MEIFLVAAPDQEDLTAMVNQAFRSSESYKLADHLWLVSKKNVSTSSEAFRLLYDGADGQSSETPVTKTLIVPVSSYYGFGNVAVWQWINSRQQAS